MEFNITNKDRVVKTVKVPGFLGTGVMGMMLGPVIGLATGLLVGVCEDVAKLIRKKK